MTPKGRAGLSISGSLTTDKGKTRPYKLTCSICVKCSPQLVLEPIRKILTLRTEQLSSSVFICVYLWFQLRLQLTFPIDS